MIIVSQGKTVHINYDNIEATYLLKKDDNIKINMRGNYDYTIGEYETMERAKEVLQEIVMLFKEEEMLHIRKSSLNNLDELAEPKYILKPVYRPKVYEMPEN